MYVHVPSDSFGSTLEKAYGTLDIADMPAPEYSISTTPKLFISTARASAASPLKSFFPFVSSILHDLSIKNFRIIFYYYEKNKANRFF